MRNASSSPVSNPCEGTHTDSEDDHQQQRTSTHIIGVQHTNRLPVASAPVFNAFGSRFSSTGKKLDALEIKAQKKTSRKNIAKRRENRVSLSLRNLQREIKKLGQRSTRSMHLVTDPAIHHQMIQFKVLPQRNLLLESILTQVMIRYFKFNFIWCCVAPTIHNLLLVL